MKSSEVNEDSCHQRQGSPAPRTPADAAARVLDQSIADATVDDITREAGGGAFYIYFRDKYDILMALADRLNEQLFEQSHLQLDRHTPPFERISISLLKVLEAWTQHAGVYRSLTLMALSREDFRALNRELRAVFLQQIRRDLERSIERGHAKPIDPAVTAKSLAAMMDWLCLLWFGLGEEPFEGASTQLPEVASTLARLWYRVVYASDPD
jgi:AcrR family transcriptional regulator